MLQDVILDFETFYDDRYSLDKMENAEYVMDPRFEVIGMSLKCPGDVVPRWYSGTFEELKAVLAQIDWANTRLVSHNARFDGSILEWRFGFKPAAYLCTMVGSRPHFVPYAKSQGLNVVSRYLGVGVKGNYVHAVKGMRRADFDVAQLADYGVYCGTDSTLAEGIKFQLQSVLPPEEQEVIDLTLKKYLRPKLLLDRAALVARLASIDAERGERLRFMSKEYGVVQEQLTSRNKFAVILAEALGNPKLVPMKINKNGRATYAFAKDDVPFKALQAHPDKKVRDLVGSKLMFSSTLERSRIEKLIHLHDVMGGVLPAPLVYYGAHTGRFSGDHGINLQNLPRVEYNKDKSLKKGHLRFALKAPPGYSVVAADLSNIEARLVSALAGQDDLTEGFRLGKDIYSEFASDVYGYPVNKKDHPTERFVGKTCILGLGYGMGWRKFQLKMAQEGIVMSDQEAQRIVNLYRSKYAKIPALWRQIEYACVQNLTKKGGLQCSNRGGLTFAHERIILPNGMPIIYPGIRAGAGGVRFDYRYASKEVKDAMKDSLDDASTGQGIWGGGFLENVAQALARIILTRAELTLARHGIVAALQVHDELVFLIPTSIVEKVVPAIEKVLTKPVDWLPELPIACEIGHGPTYGDAK